MLKKRILASTMASVMALSSVSVVAFADDKAEAPKTEAVTAKVLEEYLDEIEKNIEKGVYDDYGTKFGDIFTKAYEAARLAVEDDDADYVVASYQALKSVLAKAEDITVTQLEDLVDDLEGKYNKGNEINEELGDLYYDADTWSDFEIAYDAAKTACDSDNKTEICDAYFTLQDANDNLKKKTLVTKAKFTQAYRAYRAIIEQENKYENWTRGEATENVNSGCDDDDDFTGEVVTYGDLYGIISGAANATTLGGEKPTGTGTTWIKFPAENGTAMGSTLEEAIDAAYAKLVEIKTARETTYDAIVDAYNACNDAVRVYNGWKMNTVRRGSASSFASLVRSNAIALWTIDHDKDGNADALNLASSKKAAFFTPASGAKYTFSIDVDDGKIYLENSDTAADLVIHLDANNKLKYKTADGAFDPDTSGTTGKTLTVPKKATDNGKIEVTKYMPEFNLTTAGADFIDKLDTYCKTGTYGVTLKDALQAKANIDEFVEDDTDATKDFSKNFDETADAPDKALSKDYNNIVSVTDKSNSAAAYSLAYRILVYALDDIMPEPDKKYKKSQVKEYVEKANDLLELAQDSATFATQAEELADALAATAEWLAAASKKDYKEYEPVDYTPTMKIAAADKKVAPIDDGSTSTDVWKEIDKRYKNLNDKLADYPYSYAEMVETIANVSEGLDDKAYGNSENDIRAALDKVAYGLVTLETDEDNMNNAYDETTYEFIPYNRINQNDGTDAEEQLVKDYKALLEAIEKAAEAPAGIAGDTDLDGVLELEDAKMVLQGFLDIITLTADNIKAGDMDGDSDADLDDAKAILAAFLAV